MLKLISKVNDLGLPLISHLGFTPQILASQGKAKVQGKNEFQAQELLRQAKELTAAGVKALVLELVPENLAKKITESISIPTIGIGAGRFCDGQILVTEDLLGRNQFRAKFIKNYLNQHEESKIAISSFIREVQTDKFPKEENCF